MAREQMGQGAKGPGSELARVLLADSLLAVNWPGSEKAVNLVWLHGTDFIGCRRGEGGAGTGTGAM